MPLRNPAYSGVIETKLGNEEDEYDTHHDDISAGVAVSRKRTPTALD